MENGVEYTYLLSLSEGLTSSHCKGASVCRTQPGVNTDALILGNANSATIYMEGQYLLEGLLKYFFRLLTYRHIMDGKCFMV